MDYEIDDFYVGPPLIRITTIEHMKKYANEWLNDEQKFMLIEIEEYDD